MSDSLDPMQNAKLRKFAELEVDRQSAAIDRMLDQHVTDFKWLTASLMALNSGGAIAVLNSDSVTIYGKQCAGLSFVAGILLALCIARLSQYFSQRSINPLIGYRAFWLSVSQGELFDQNVEKQAIGHVQKATKAAWTTQLAGWLSVLAFVIGTSIAGLNLSEQQVTPKVVHK